MKNSYQLFISLLILYTFLLLQSCSKDDNSPTETTTTGTIQGKVTLANGTAPITNATIVTNPTTSSVSTDQNGEYKIGNVKAGTYIVKASKTDYLDSFVNVSVDAGKTCTANIQMTTVQPNVPVLSSPNNGATNISNPPTLVWSKSSFANSYTLQISESSNFSSFEYNQSGLTDTSQQIAGLNNGKTYYWRVNARNTYWESDWSSPVWNFTTVFVCGSSQVQYEGKTYNTVLIGTQCWLKENLNVGTRITGSQNQANNGTIEKYCYDNISNNCTIYGGLYQWDEAMQYSTIQGAQGICPTGWHIPTATEYQTLKTFVDADGNALKAIGQGTGSGAGTNTSGFSALLSGSRTPTTNWYFIDLGYNGGFWSSTNAPYNTARNLELNRDHSYILGGDTGRKWGYSVRCVKD